MKPKLVRTLAALCRETARWRAEGLRYAVAPTMGAIHSGHTELVAEGLKRADRVIATIFINPMQFAAHEDLGKYPRDEEGDVRKLGQAGCHMIYVPNPEEIYPEGFCTTVTLGGPAKAGLEDKFRPQFFDGVTTVVAKLFIQTGADCAMFGEKDYQQLKVVTRMAKDLDIPIEVVGIPTVREEDGLAKSSRNVYLSKPERQQALAIHSTIGHAAERIRGGLDLQSAMTLATRTLLALGFRVDYVTVRNAETLAPPQHRGEPLRILAAAWLGKTRLIDNVGV
ncbi:pantoate--beta-alanine ligase [Aestuariivirga sp.]|uniref:pantoate--beta-alanine ligase n=1 Tax=Aestuariivirga sp. TaxID=2650926 RepID=UPI0025B98A4F|nr:pantoate--beta-alanine ligase [Aestuariivirga sp.]MCA3556359.1 pantoate--beta-alanine ligase [Aestuariivirga sp.]